MQSERTFLEYSTYQIGRYGPVILAIMTLYLTWGLDFTSKTFSVMFVMDQLVNNSIKLIFRQRRPGINGQIFSALAEHPNEAVNKPKYNSMTSGMPSGHAESAAFSLMFIILTFNNIYISLIFSIFFLWTCIQRVLYRKHYIDQVIVGTLIGSIMGYITHKIVRIQNTSK